MNNPESALLDPALVFFGLEATDAFDLFDQLEPRLKAAGHIKGTWRKAIGEREEKYPTGLACPVAQIAIPHTDPVNIDKPYIAVVKPAKPIAFQPMGGIGDEVHAQLVINLGITRDGGQVQTLQALMGIFMDEAKAAKVMSQTTAEGMVEVLRGYFEAAVA